MAVDAEGNRYLVDPGANRIRKLSADGTLSTVVVVGLDRPAGVAVDAAGNLYVTESGSHRVFKLFAGTITTVGERR
jgi:serine/threonine-protein kinase